MLRIRLNEKELSKEFTNTDVKNIVSGLKKNISRLSKNENFTEDQRYMLSEIKIIIDNMYS